MTYKYNYTGSVPLLISIDGKLTRIMPGADFTSSSPLGSFTGVKVIPESKPVKKKTVKKATKKATLPIKEDSDGNPPSST